MKKINAIILLIASNAFCQTVEILEYQKLPQAYAYDGFGAVQPSTDVSQLTFVAKIKSTGSLKKATYLYQFIKAEAQKIGANLFKVDSYTKLNDGQNGELIASVYRASDEMLEVNLQNAETNKIYVFGDENMLSEKNQGYRINGDKKEISAGKFTVYELPIGKDLKISKGGFTGTTDWFRGGDKSPNAYITFGGFGISGASGNYTPGSQGVGIGFTTGKINQVPDDVAAALLHIFSKQE